MSLEIFLCIETFLSLHYMAWNSFIIIMNNSSINHNCWSHNYVRESHRSQGKVQLIQKSSKIFFLDIFTWFHRARRAL